jgi:hypothetical protein
MVTGEGWCRRGSGTRERKEQEKNSEEEGLLLLG